MSGHSWSLLVVSLVAFLLDSYYYDDKISFFDLIIMKNHSRMSLTLDKTISCLTKHRWKLIFHHSTTTKIHCYLWKDWIFITLWHACFIYQSNFQPLQHFYLSDKQPPFSPVEMVSKSNVIFKAMHWGILVAQSAQLCIQSFVWIWNRTFVTWLILFLFFLRHPSSTD